MPPCTPPHVRRAPNGDDDDDDNDDFFQYSREFESWRTQLANTVSAIDSYSNLVSQTTYPNFVNPGLEVSDIKIPLPLQSSYADQIKAVARSALFGAGINAVVDQPTRLAWEFQHDEFRVTNPAWMPFLTKVIVNAGKCLGMKPEEIRIKAHKLLLQDKGHFLETHRDSDNPPDTVGNVLVCLPSQHEGGEFHLSYGDQKSVLVTAPSSGFDLKTLAWFSDVTPEVKPLTSGHRLALTYKIIQRRQYREPIKSAAFFVQQQTQLRELLEQSSRDFSAVERLVFLTDHKYDSESLSASNSMRGRDRAVFETLRSVCVENDWYIFLANIQRKTLARLVESSNGSRPFHHETEIVISLDSLYSTDGTELAQDVELNEGDVIVCRPMRIRHPDEKEECKNGGDKENSSVFRYYDSAIVLIPKKKLHGLLDDTNTEVLMSLVIGDYLQNPNKCGLRGHAIDFMSRALSYGNAVDKRSTMITLGWISSNDEIYRDAVRSYTESGEVPEELLEKLAFLTKTASSIRALDWQTCWWELFLAPVNMTRLFDAADKVVTLLEKDDANASFKSLAISSKKRLIESKDSLELADLDGVMAFAVSMWDNREWINEQLVPKLQSLQDKTLLSKVIGVLDENVRAGTMPGAEDIAKEIVGSHLSCLRLGKVNFWAKGRRPSDPESYDYHPTKTEPFIEVDRFCDLMEICLVRGWMHEASELFKLSHEHARQYGDESQQRNERKLMGKAPDIVLHLFRSLTFISHSASAPFIEPQQKLVEHILRNYVLWEYPALPVKLQGWASQPRGCSSNRTRDHGGSCNICQPLDDFLVSPALKTAEFCDTQVRRQHIEKLLPVHLFECRTDPCGRDGRQCQTLIVNKRVKGAEYRLAKKEYMDNVASLESKLKPFGTFDDLSTKILGKDLYGELVELNRLPGSWAARAAKSDPPSVAGVKREAQDDSVFPPASRPLLGQ